ncbi:hypothetical protein PanWU01x14_146890 [Parasponia andersonii]|uniref:Uncharacterized protein n=1 Tax=Parasponia andersonii TaxID=3476 RepID=A0A2P5CJW2_PARAD|nr:hypothetical protein PanWU01x14_146890 [Parasponia andersonii]
MVSISVFPLSSLPLFFLLFFSVFICLNYTSVAQCWPPLQLPTPGKSLPVSLPNPKATNLDEETMDSFETSSRGVYSAYRATLEDIDKHPMESLGPDAEPSSKCRNIEMNLMSTPVALLTPQSDVLPASLSELKPAELDKDHMDSLGHEAGTSSTGQNVAMTPMTSEANPSALHMDPTDSLAQEAGTSSTGRNVEVTPMPMPVALLTRQSDMLPISHSVRGKPLSSAHGSYGFFGTGSRDFQYRPKCCDDSNDGASCPVNATIRYAANFTFSQRQTPQLCTWILRILWHKKQGLPVQAEMLRSLQCQCLVCVMANYPPFLGS